MFQFVELVRVNLQYIAYIGISARISSQAEKKRISTGGTISDIRNNENKISVVKEYNKMDLKDVPPVMISIKCAQ